HTRVPHHHRPRCRRSHHSIPNLRPNGRIRPHQRRLLHLITPAETAKVSTLRTLTHFVCHSRRESALRLVILSAAKNPRSYAATNPGCPTLRATKGRDVNRPSEVPFTSSEARLRREQRPSGR